MSLSTLKPPDFFCPPYPSIPDALIVEMSGWTPQAELPHFKDLIARAAGQPRVGRVWQYYTV
jgi:hypothetical protein